MSLPCTTTQVRDLISWMHDTSAIISTVEPARSVSGAEALLAKHSEYKAEIDAREESVTMVTKAGKKLILQGHYANTEVHVYTEHFFVFQVNFACRE